MGSWIVCGPFAPGESRPRSLGELEALEREEDRVRGRERLQSPVRSTVLIRVTCL